MLHVPEPAGAPPVARGQDCIANAPSKALGFCRGGGRVSAALGNVHGWASEDEGTGEYGALAEYVIQYADGVRQTVPLVAWRTTDDWIAPPRASEVVPEPAGKNWHLNVLGVELRPVLIETILFRDLGTPSSPVLAAATIELN